MNSFTLSVEFVMVKQFLRGSNQSGKPRTEGREYAPSLNSTSKRCSPNERGNACGSLLAEMFIPYLLDSSRNAGDFWHDSRFNYGGKFVKKSNIEEYRFTVSKKTSSYWGRPVPCRTKVLNRAAKERSCNSFLSYPESPTAN